jgi:hypothetical protein
MRNSPQSVLGNRVKGLIERENDVCQPHRDSATGEEP